jgi:hypothetical protein
VRLAATALVLACLGLPAPAAEALHGGLLTQAAGLELELVATPSLLQLYVRGQSPAPDLAKSRARITLRAGPDQQVVELRPAGDRMEATGAFVVPPGTEVVATITTPGRAAVTARYVLP